MHNVDVATNRRNSFINVWDEIPGIVDAIAIMTIKIDICAT
jgi:hypothetical protein